jgi:predicted nucleic acid-binding Zn finger protein
MSETTTLAQRIEPLNTIDDRHERAIEVKETYLIEDCGSGTFIMQHPEEPDRCYVIQTGKNDCTCPDFQRRTEVVLCKHLIAARMILGIDEGEIDCPPLPTGDFANSIKSLYPGEEAIQCRKAS